MTEPAPTALTAEEAARLVAWYAALGVDAVSEEGRDRFGEAPAAKPPRSEAPLPASAPPSPALLLGDGNALAASAEESVMAARAAAAQAGSLEELEALLNAFNGCALKATASRLVFSDGVAGSRVMLVGEAPGRDEDRVGKPFVGRSGQLLDKMLAAIGLDRTSVYIANVVPWRPPGNRTPTPQETQICLPFLQRQIELAKPEVLVFLGGSAAQSVLRTSEGILRLRGRWHDYDAGGRQLRAMATLHPAFLLRSPLQKRLAWRDMLAVKRALDGR
jgi:DNA polymerase